MHTTKQSTRTRYTAALTTALLLTSGMAWAQTAPKSSTTSNASSDTSEEDTVVLSPFEVSAENEVGYAAATTLAGNRLNTELRDIGNAVTVVTSQFLRDIGATDNSTLLQYTVGGEVGSVYGNYTGTGDGAALDESSKFTNPNQNTRVRGLTSADNTRDYFQTDIPWDAYNVDRVDLQRGPNSILFGQGSPAGIINSGSRQASFRDSNEVNVRYGSFGSTRGSVDLNKVIIKNQLAVRLDGLYDDTKFEQEPAYDLDKRLYGALRWEPEALKKNGMRTIIKANYENGQVSSNRPRSLPPIDLITPFFQTGTYPGNYVYDAASGTYKSTRTFNNLNRETFIPSQLQDNNTNRPNHGQATRTSNAPGTSGQPRPAYNPWLGNFGQQFGGPLVFFDGSSSAVPATYWVAEPNTQYGIAPDGTRDKGVGGEPFMRPGGITNYQTFARNAGLPFSQFGIYKDKSLTDPSIFDFYHNLLDGPNKHEWQKFHAYNLSFAQTFFDDQAGFELIYNRESYSNGQLSLLSGEKQAIGIDVNSVYSDGTPDSGLTGEPLSDGTKNPNVGRPYLSDSSQFGNNSYTSRHNDFRGTLFATHDFAKDHPKDSYVRRFLGTHTLTGLYSRETQNTETRSWQRYAADDAYEAFLNPNGNGSHLKFTDNTLTPNNVIYLGPSLLGASSATGANIPRPTAVQTITSGKVRLFDSHWNKPTDPSAAGYVNPSALWLNNYYEAPANPADIGVAGVDPRVSTQSENPANYVGWTEIPVNIIDSETSQANRDLLTTNAKLAKSQISSQAFVWQGHFWDNSIVGTWGVRKDVSKSWTVSRDVNGSKDPHGHLDLGDSYKLPDQYTGRLQVLSHAWTVMAHINQLPGIGKFANDLPIQLSLFYNRSTDFQPASQRVDLYGEPLAAPAGKTIDKGILLETRDGKYSLKINRYETVATNASSTALGGTWFIGASQAWSGNWANRFEFDLTGDTIDTHQAHDGPSNGSYNYAPAPKPDGTTETQAEADAREAAAVAAYRAWQKSVDPRFYKAWGIDLNNLNKSIGYSVPNGFTVTEDSQSKGWEVEFNAVPIKNWRIALNMSKTNATRTNIGGSALAGFISAYENALKNTPAGDLRIWWGGAGNDTSLIQWNTSIGSEWAQRKLQEGTNVPELRQWHTNLISNYEFDHGFLKGFNVGIGVRYESSIVIGYKPLQGATANDISFDIANPYEGPAQTNFDFWLGYTRKLSKRLEWNIQLNVRNAGIGDELTVLTTQPDGSPASYRIRATQTWELSNTFRF
ncbi:MAG TPA: TonB-dependent receptor plug domain-containing protein [Opitutaceae bacterium]|nr:TonB-dependent receptor plug domain-containing protein [Opitutaceae bacterium]